MDKTVYFKLRKRLISASTAFVVAKEVARNRELGRTLKKEKD